MQLFGEDFYLKSAMIPYKMLFKVSLNVMIIYELILHANNLKKRWL